MAAWHSLQHIDFDAFAGIPAGLQTGCDLFFLFPAELAMHHGIPKGFLLAFKLALSDVGQLKDGSERAYAAAMENADFAARGAQPGMDQAAMRENAATQREGMQQADSTARAQMQEVGQNNRFGQTHGLAQQKFGMEQETQGIQNRDASLISAMRAQIAQEQDPTKRQSAVQRMREVQGTQQADPYLVVPGGQQIDPTSQRAYNTPASVFNRQTGQWVQQPGQGGAAIPQAGAVQGGYRFNGGDPSKQTSWEKV